MHLKDGPLSEVFNIFSEREFTQMLFVHNSWKLAIYRPLIPRHLMSTSSRNFGHLDLPDIQGGVKVAFEKVAGSSKASQPCVIYVPGYGSGMEGSKAVHLSRHCAAAGLPYVRHTRATTFNAKIEPVFMFRARLNPDQHHSEKSKFAFSVAYPDQHQFTHIRIRYQSAISRSAQVYPCHDPHLVCYFRICILTALSGSASVCRFRIRMESAISGSAAVCQIRTRIQGL